MSSKDYKNCITVWENACDEITQIIFVLKLQLWENLTTQILLVE